MNIWHKWIFKKKHEHFEYGAEYWLWSCGQYIFGSEVFGTIPICFNPSKHSLGTCVKAKQNPAKL